VWSLASGRAPANWGAKVLEHLRIRSYAASFKVFQAPRDPPPKLNDIGQPFPAHVIGQAIQQCPDFVLDCRRHCSSVADGAGGRLTELHQQVALTHLVTLPDGDALDGPGGGGGDAVLHLHRPRRPRPLLRRRPWR
jgi:hypothetical protein